MIKIARSQADWMIRIALAVVYIWFGILKILNLSPAEKLVEDLYNSTFLSSLVSFVAFLILLGLLEVGIGIGFLLPNVTKQVVVAFGLHMVTTFMPLALLPQDSWQAALVPTLVGQYIIKNLVLIAAASALLVKPKT